MENVITFNDTKLKVISSGKNFIDRVPKVICHLYATETKITDAISRRWVNNQSQIKISKYYSKINTHSIYFPGKQQQKLMTNENIFYGLTSFTLSLWLKLPSTYTSYSTFIEIIPKELLLNSYMENNDKETKQLMSVYKSTSLNKLNIGIITDTESNVINIDKTKLNKYLNKTDWNNIIIVYDNSRFIYYINGNKIADDILNFDISSLPKNYITIIGGDSLNDLGLSKSVHMYLNDLIIYDGIIFDYKKDYLNIPVLKSLSNTDFIPYSTIDTARKIEIVKKKKIKYNFNTVKNDTLRQTKALNQLSTNMDYRNIKYEKQKFVIGIDN